MYIFAPDPTLVIKFEVEPKSFQNVYEWHTWDRVKEYKPVAKWFAPCVNISECGTILLQKRTTPVPNKMLPKKVPAFFIDLKRSN